MAGYVKIFRSITVSSIWREPAPTFKLWIAMLTLAGPDGRVDASDIGLAGMANLSIEDTHTALCSLESPDPHSRTKSNDGRRIKPIDGGWQIINFTKYDRYLQTEHRRQYRAQWMSEKRQKEREQREQSVNRREQTVIDRDRCEQNVNKIALQVVDNKQPREQAVNACEHPHPHLQPYPNTGTTRVPDARATLNTLPDTRLVPALRKGKKEVRLIERLIGVLGKEEMDKNGGLWRTRAREDSEKLTRALNDLSQTMKTDTIKNPGAYLTDLWNRFA